MARSVKEWIGRTDDTPAPPRVRRRIFDRDNGICYLSGNKINPPKDKWQLHHIKGLEEGGENRESNLAPVLVEPHKKESKRQQAIKKKVNRKRNKHIGVTKPKGKMKSAPFQASGKKTTIKKTPLPPRQLFEKKG